MLDYCNIMPVSSTRKPLVIWRFLDGKSGHEKQSQALIDILSESYEVTAKDYSVKHSAIIYLWLWLKRNTLGPDDSIKPQLIIGAGHRTHIPVLLAAYQQRAKTMIIMSPSLPLHWFDGVIAPEHDFLDKPKPNNIITVPFALASPINSQPNPERGLILVGGPSKHYGWDDDQVALQINNLVARSAPNIDWLLSSSRRTPNTTLPTIKKHCRQSNLQMFDVNQLPGDWLFKQLKTAGNIWITADSASMIAEALNTRAKVGILQPIGPAKSTKISKAIASLIANNHLSPDYQKKIIQFIGNLF